MPDLHVSTDTLVSDLSDDPDMIEIVEMFIDELPSRATAIQEALNENDLGSLAMLVHQLKGAAGGYGFPTITDMARQLEQTAKTEQDLAKLSRQVEDLASLCHRARATRPSYVLACQSR